ncbi:MAG: amino acid adenylation domain-containing protein, partial [bacterium]|nr:amino acid adenylation domain-containing protein [bacterium]
GDNTRWCPDGNIEYLGRIDHQVKIRGFRIEPGEIESSLLTHPHIKETVVVPVETKTRDKALCAYVVIKKENDENAAPIQITETQLRQYQAERLPDYMIPTYYIQLPELPLTPNGKIDRKALPPVTAAGTASGTKYTPPKNTVEKKLEQIWKIILGREIVGTNENYFTIGGDS